MHLQKIPSLNLFVLPCTQTICQIFIKLFKSHLHVLFMKNTKFEVSAIICFRFVLVTHTYRLISKKYIFWIQGISRLINPSKSQLRKFDLETKLSLPFVEKECKKGRFCKNIFFLFSISLYAFFIPCRATKVSFLFIE